jgi:hypothetical protein
MREAAWVVASAMYEYKQLLALFLCGGMQEWRLHPPFCLDEVWYFFLASSTPVTSMMAMHGGFWTSQKDREWMV